MTNYMEFISFENEKSRMKIAFRDRFQMKLFSIYFLWDMTPIRVQSEGIIVPKSSTEARMLQFFFFATLF